MGYVKGLETPALPKPFVPVRVKESLLYNEEGHSDHKGKLRIYIDPRGKIEFAIGIPPWIGKVLQTRLARQNYVRDADILVDKAGNEYVLGPTAYDVEERFRSVQWKAKQRREAIGGKTYIGLFFSAEGPKFDHEGNEIPVPEGKLRLDEEVRGHSEEISIRLTTHLGVLVTDETGRKRFFIEDEDGKLFSHHISQDVKPLFIEDTPENQRKVMLIRRTLASAIDMLADLFGHEAEHFLRTMALAPTLRLNAPSETHPEPPARIPRDLVIRRKRK